MAQNIDGIIAAISKYETLKDKYWDIVGDQIILDGWFTLDELKIIVKAWEENQEKG